MIRMIQSGSAGHAKAYFADALSKADYYLDDQELQGTLSGRLAERLDLAGPVTKELFYALCENRNPETEQALTPRSKLNRTIGYDINFHCPKSVSVLHALAPDPHILDAFEKSVAETMRDIEEAAQTRIRKNGKQEDRQTGELIWAEFVHQTARPVEGHAPDPHLHMHCFVFNATFDKQENKIKAAQFRDIMRHMPYYQARFHKRLADRLTDIGYRIKPTKNAFEIEGVPQAVINHFSKRSDQIGRVAKEKGITDAKELDALGAKTRSKKEKGLGMWDLKKIWRQDMERLTEELNEDAKLQPVRHAKVKTHDLPDVHKCIDQALKHCFERASVVSDRKLLEAAYRFTLGHSHIGVEEIAVGIKNDARLLRIDQGGKVFCTTKGVLQEEKHMVELARKSRGRMMPVYPVPPLLDSGLTDQQKNAIRHLMRTTNRVCIVRGAAGTGKTRLMQQAVECYRHARKKVFVVAPTAEASRGVLKEEGFKNAETVAKLLTDKELQKNLTGQVLWVDEAGLLGTQDMVKLLELAEKQNARLVLGGDTRQHAAVVRGDALRILNTIGGIKAAELDQIKRQKNGKYREAVQDLSCGDITKGFEKLDAIEAIKTVDPLDPHKGLVEDYIKAVKKKKSALVICPTHQEGEAVTDAIRAQLREEGLIGKKEIKITRLANLNLTEAERSDSHNYQKGLKIQFNQNVPNAKRGSIWTVKDIQGFEVQLENDEGKTLKLPRHEAKHFEVFKEMDMTLSKGDQLRITRNGFDNKKKRLNNGMRLEVVGIGLLGEITLANKASRKRFTLNKQYGHFAHAHCITSHASQGKTVDEVFIAQPSSTFTATNAKQFYVSVSRGREMVHIYTDDKEALLEHACELSDRQSALELILQSNHEKHLELNLKNDSAPSKTIERIEKHITHENCWERDYEPGI